MNISVILCTWNNSQRLDKTLTAFCALEMPPGLNWQLVVVNNNSTDATPVIVKGYSERLPIKYVEEPKQGLSYARNAGLRNADGELLIFTDDDVIPCSGWLTVYWQAYQNNPSGCFWGGPIQSEFESVSVNPELLRHAPFSVKGLTWGSAERALRHGEWFVSANWACPATAIGEQDPFDVDKGLNPTKKTVSVGEETDLMERLKGRGLTPVYLPLAKLVHFVPRDKTSFTHIAARVRAFGYYCGEKDRLSVAAMPWFFGFPLWVLRDMASHGFKVLLSFLMLEINYASCLELSKKFGYLQGFRRK